MAFNEILVRPNYGSSLTTLPYPPKPRCLKLSQPNFNGKKFSCTPRTTKFNNTLGYIPILFTIATFLKAISNSLALAICNPNCFTSEIKLWGALRDIFHGGFSLRMTTNVEASTPSFRPTEKWVHNYFFTRTK